MSFLKVIDLNLVLHLLAASNKNGIVFEISINFTVYQTVYVVRMFVVHF
jgi:hypothetical protein